MTTPDNNRPLGSPDAGESDRDYADALPRTTEDGEAARTADVGEPFGTTDVGEADRGYTDEPAGTTDVGEADRAYAEEPVGAAGAGEADPAYANEADRSAYGNADRLEDTDRTDALDGPEEYMEK